MSRPADTTYADLLRQLEDWRERALAAESRAGDLERKLRGLQKQSDPREKLRRRLEREQRTEKKRRFAG